MDGLINHFLGFFSRLGSHNFLAIGIVVILLWLLISGIRKGLRKESRNKRSEENNENNNVH